MPDWSNKELDKLFQQGSERHDFEYNPDAWKQMDELLNQERRRRILFWLWFGGIGLAIIAFVLFFWMQVADDGKTVSAQEEDSNQLENVEYPQPETSEGGSTADTTARDSVISAQKPNIITSSNQTTLSISKSPTPSTPTTSQKSLQRITENQSAQNGLEQQPTLTSGVEEELGSPHQHEAVAAVDSSLAFILLPLPLLDVDTLAIEPREELLPELEWIDYQVEEVEKIKNMFLLGILGTGEITSVGIDNFKGLDWKGGISFGYYQGGKYGLNLGVNYVRKFYEAQKGEYHPPYGFWTRKIAPETTTGMCDVLEIPVALEYYVSGYDKSSFFASAGLTSYLMFRQRYYYYYENPEPDLIKKWYGEGMTPYWFGMGQVTIGWNQKLTNRLYIQLAPYVQLPIAKMGHGEVKLYTIGTTVRFNVQL